MLLALLVDQGREAAAFAISFGKARFDFAELGACRRQRVLAFGEAARQPRGLVERLIERELQRALLVFEQRQLLAVGGKLGLELADALFRGVDLLGKAALAF